MDLRGYEIEIRHHVFIRAMQRGISPDLIEKCIITGKHETFGKSYMKFITRSVICIGEVKGMKVCIITIERIKK